MKHCPLCEASYEEGDRCPVDGATLLREAQGADSLVGRILNDTYKIEEEIGAGGMGTVYRALQISLDRQVAIKVLQSQLYGSSEAVKRFFQEARTLSALNHPNVVSVIDFGNTEDGLMFIVMELVRGRPLDDFIVDSGKLDVGDALDLMRQVCAGVGAAHRSGLVHRDLKPSNLLVAEADEGGIGTVKVVDFGIAKVVDDDQTQLTGTGMLMGSPGFISPEQIAGDSEADARSDVYALGAILYFMLTGYRPYAGTTPPAILAKQLSTPPDPDREPLRKWPALADVVLKSMNRQPGERYQSPAELLESLEDVVASSKHETRPRVPTLPLPTEVPSSSGSRRWIGTLAVVSVLIVIIVAFGWIQMRSPQAAQEETAAEQDGAANAGSTARGVATDRITIGMSAAFSGPSRELGRAMQIGIQTRIKESNDSGGIHGREVELVALDDGYEPSRAVENTLELLNERQVFAVVGNVGTPTAEVTAPLVVNDGTLFFGAFTGAALLRQDPPNKSIFNYRASYAEEARAIVAYFTQIRGVEPSRIAVFAQQDAFGDAGYDGVVKSLHAAGHEGSVLRVGYRRNSLELAGAAEELLAASPVVEAVVLVATYRAAARFIALVRDARPQIRLANLSFVGGDALAEELRELWPGYLEGVIVAQVVPPPWSDEPGVVHYRESLEKYYPAERPSFVSLEGYIVAAIFEQGLRRAGPRLTTNTLTSALESIDSLDLGFGAPISFGPGRHQAVDRVWGTVLDAAGNYSGLDLTP